MAVRKVTCLACGAPVRVNGCCSECKIPQQVLKKAFNTSNYHYNIGLDKARVRDLSGAIDSLLMSLRYNKKNINSRNLLGLIYFEMGEVVLALSHFVISVNYKSDKNLAINYLKELRSNPTMLDTANQMAKKFNQALMYTNQQSFDLAEVQLRSVLSVNPHFVKGYLLLALVSMESMNYERARKALIRVLKIDRTNTLAIRYLKEIGETEESIMKIRDESQDNDVFQEMDEVKEDRTPKKIFKEVKIEAPLHDEVKLNQLKEFSLLRYSSVYVIAGLLIGVGLMWFMFIPAKNKKLQNEINTMKTDYSNVLSSKNAAIDSLNKKVLDYEAEIDKLVNGNNTDLLTPEPDYSNINSGLSEDDLNSIIQNE